MNAPLPSGRPPRSPSAPYARPDAVSPRAVAARFDASRGPLLDWFAAAARDLPWRRSFRPGDEAGLTLVSPARRAPYAVWISEIMLQQTVVNAVIPHFERWMGRFPDVPALAEASADEVLRAWAGLGYYARARNLHAGARALAAGGVWPRTAEEWRAVPGVGEYTAGAVASLAFGARAPILDGNVVRIFARLLGLEFLPGDNAAARRAYWDLARAWVEGPGDPGVLNESLMELGALVCTPAAPRCGACPLGAACASRAAGWQTRLPPARRRAPVETVPATALIARRGDRVLAEARAEGFLAGHVMFPLFLGEDAGDWRAAFQARHPERTLSVPKAVGRVKHVIMSRRYDVEIWTAAVGGPLRGAEWLSLADADERLSNALARKIWKAGRPEA